jgi:hypothetical protein
VIAMSPFQPKGDRARWRAAYDLFARASVNDVVTYDQLAEAMDVDLEDRHAIQMAVRRAAKEHEEQDKRAVEAVPNKGYRIVEAPEHLRLAKSHQRRSTRALKRGQSKVVNVDLNEVADPEARKAFEVMALGFAAQMEFNQRIVSRMRRQDAAFESLKQRQEATTEEHERRLRRLEEMLGDLDGPGETET